MSPQLEPVNGRLHVVRWIRKDGRDAKHRYFRRVADARRFLEKLRASGRDVAMFSTSVTWERNDRW